ncbi:motility associated factor glycosyltransferase family protein [Calidifontibacillus erzurumensis]|uniref:Motility associated factor glycosyltransferase family protein n=1 Tax=Calidifontibacillus erzurumensis TaxID=2741433 RepID=A0A8J8KBC5_9BACI|nr:6-hydroxymethylpterin diphosphokinase MptE-like protein [Calidifontibacillus erzurumensis]NSL51789.1 motility associated factor glycosyltransferase family protein [Calidifontibacillus erzurumensis]
MKWHLKNTKTVPTLIIHENQKDILLYSKYDPMKDVITWIDGIQINKQSKDIIIIGMGLGYHVLHLAQKYNNYQIHVFEFNNAFAEWLIKNELLNFIDSNKNIKFYYQKDLRKLLAELSSIMIKAQNNFFIHKPSLNLIENYEIKLMLQSFIIKRDTINDHGELLDFNYKKNIELNDKDIRPFLSLYKNHPIILASAGPSLTKHLSLLKKALESKIQIACVGTALKPLISAGIIPSFIMISDPNDKILEQFENLYNLNIPLFYLSTANNLTVKTYNGPRYVVWQKGYGPAEVQAKAVGVPLVETGGSVATCLLDLLVKMGFNKIALVGQDLAFTDFQSHAQGTHAYRKIKGFSNLIKVDDYYLKNKIYTSRNLYIYLRWFEMYAEKINHVELWNCTEGGAHIKGWKHKTLKEFLNNVNSAE